MRSNTPGCPEKFGSNRSCRLLSVQIDPRSLFSLQRLRWSRSIVAVSDGPAEEKFKKISKNCGDDVRRYRVSPIICRRSFRRTTTTGIDILSKDLARANGFSLFLFFSSFVRHALSRHGQTTGRTKFRATTGRISCDKKKKNKIR